MATAAPSWDPRVLNQHAALSVSRSNNVCSCIPLPHDFGVTPGRKRPSPAMSRCSQTSSPTRPTRRSEAAWGLTWDRPWCAWTTWQCCAGVTGRPSWTRTCSPARSSPEPSRPRNNSIAWRAAGLQGIAERFHGSLA